MKTLAEFQVGSQYFFKGLPDFRPHDNDTVRFVDEGDGSFKYIKQISGGNCLFIVVRHSNQELIDYALNSKGPAMQVGKYLVPEVIEFLGLSFDDLRQLQPLIERLDNLHKYEKIIYDSYFKNGSFTLTEEQRLEAFNEYSQSREIYKKRNTLLNNNERKN